MTKRLGNGGGAQLESRRSRRSPTEPPKEKQLERVKPKDFWLRHKHRTSTERMVSGGCSENVGSTTCLFALSEQGDVQTCATNTRRSQAARG